MATNVTVLVYTKNEVNIASNLKMPISLGKITRILNVYAYYARALSLNIDTGIYSTIPLFQDGMNNATAELKDLYDELTNDFAG